MLFAPAIRPDIAQITALARIAFAPYAPRIGRAPAPMTADYAALQRDPQVEIIAAHSSPDRSGPLAGFAVLLTRTGDGAPTVWLETIAVAPTTQGSGLGRRLLTLCEARARRRGFACVQLYTNAAMHENFPFYERAGYTETGRRRADDFDRVYFARSV